MEKHKDEQREELARLMYDDYSAAVGGKAFNGDALPKSDEFFGDLSKVKQANAWRVAAETAIKYLNPLPVANP